MVRGYWGDVMNSPYIPLGVEVDNPQDKENFFKQVNF